MSSSIITQQSTGLATETQDGLVSTGAQTFAGNKTFTGSVDTYSASADPIISFYRPSNGVGVGIGRMWWSGNNAASARVDYSRINTEIESNTTGSHGGRMLFMTATSGTVTEQMRIESNGDIVMGVSSPTKYTNVNLYLKGGISLGGPGDFGGALGLAPHCGSGNFSFYNNMPGTGNKLFSIENNGIVNFRNNFAYFTPSQAAASGDRLIVSANGTSTGGGYFYYNSGNTYGVISDKRIKNDIEDLTKTDAIDFIKELRPVTYSIKSDIENKKVCGFIAQEVLIAAKNEAQKNIVSKHETYDETIEDCPLIGVSDHSITPNIVSALQVLIKKTEELSAKNDALEARLAALENNNG